VRACDDLEMDLRGISLRKPQPHRRGRRRRSVLHGEDELILGAPEVKVRVPEIVLSASLC
jgi:hypothetical protein